MAPEQARRYRPRLVDEPRPTTFDVDAVNERGETVPTAIAGEHPLTVYLDKRELVTLMTLGAAPAHLALGYLRNQRIVASVDEIAAVQVDWETDSVAITSRSLAEHGTTIWDDAERGEALEGRLGKRTVTTGCGQGTVFGDLMEELDRIRLPGEKRLTEETLYTVMDRVRRHESIYKVAGAVHGCALCSNAGEDRGEILRFVEDVGRHNAVDAIAGWMWLEGVSGDDKIFYTTGRLTSEMVIKCAQMGIPFLVSRSGLTQMGWDIARRIGITMIGRCQGRHYLLFTGRERFIRLPATAFA
ncbi:formate dehydrogenase accessory sulfurtransferase FdhD [Burkholderiaceae bacterium FT117]|uniref:formate dehydrogenase accessory sulfurtransferase FdhD n=1 Tax=Zeimonas sediminis TaxID=2944268 RepID=UPI002342E742|nr:formate dehydrogenase accessory sulfurtransferase FdhD [Zeimonas sediminis]MCM5568985.1 formate dehydrogenase accessory sulfurtransferase FdhD [Zeimonas sediminis]